MVIEDLAKTVLDELRETVKTETVIGNPIHVDDTTIIPVSKVSIGFAAGGGEGDDPGTKKKGFGRGTGGGASVEPIGFVVIKGDKVKLLTFKKKSSDLDKIFKLVPDVMSLFKKDKKDKKKEEKGKSEDK